jgi:hypothetical protein
MDCHGQGRRRLMMAAADRPAFAAAAGCQLGLAKSRPSQSQGRGRAALHQKPRGIKEGESERCQRCRPNVERVSCRPVWPLCFFFAHFSALLSSVG